MATGFIICPEVPITAALLSILVRVSGISALFKMLSMQASEHQIGNLESGLKIVQAFGILETKQFGCELQAVAGRPVFRGLIGT